MSHRSEHSIELQVVFLQHGAPGGKPVRIVPILTSYCHEMLRDGKDPGQDPAIGRFCDALAGLVREESRRVCVIAGADLAHMGTRFGDAALTAVQMEQLELEDRRMLVPVAARDAAGFFEAVKADKDRRRICGFSPIYTLLRVLGPKRQGGRLLKYGQWPDPDGTVSFASLAFT